MLSSISSNTLKQYSVSFKLWWEFCVHRQIDIFNPSIPMILTFLSEQFNLGSSYGSINSHRSALSLLLGSNIGSDETIKRLLKGIYKQKPSRPKYSSTWNPDIVLNYLSGLFPNTEINLEKLTRKMVTLLALCTAQRVQTLSLIKMCNISKTNTGLKISITDIIKTSAAGREQPILFLPYFIENPNICPASTINDYMDVTSQLRPVNIDNLIISFKKPHKPASSQTLSRWIKQTLAESGVDVSVFSAHSTRHAATSAAAAHGVCIDTIRKTAGWTSSSQTFARFYNRPITDNSAFARSVCSVSNIENNT